MNSFAVLILAVQVCLIQTVFGQCLRDAYGPYWDGAAPAITAPYLETIGSPFGYKDAYGFDGACGSYGGAGVGNIAVAGELPVIGTTIVSGNVPIIGAVEFCGPACAAGAISIAGACGCVCNSPYGI